MPALLQLLGCALVAHLTSLPVGPDEPPGLVTEADVDAVLSDAELLDAFREKYVLTLNLDHRYLSNRLCRGSGGVRAWHRYHAIILQTRQYLPSGVARRLCFLRGR